MTADLGRRYEELATEEVLATEADAYCRALPGLGRRPVLRLIRGG